MIRWIKNLLGAQPPVPTLMHVTHAKSGSTWLDAILRELFGDRVAPRNKLVAAATGGDLSKHVFAPGWIYPAMFLRRDRFLAHPELRDIHRFVVIRDLRDTLVSLYFSIKVSHPNDSAGEEPPDRKALNELDLEGGMLHLLHGSLGGAARMQASWINQGEIVLRYEDLLTDALTPLREVLIERFHMPVTPRALAAAIEKTSFRNVFKRELGEENVSSHGRQGLPGDWKKHFTPKVTAAFVETYGKVLVDTGYERNDSWANGEHPG